MYLDVRKSKAGVVTYRFTFVGADGRRRRYPQSKVPAFKDRAAAEDWAKSQAAIMEAKKAYIALKLSWRSQYYQFDELLTTYGSWQKERAPNSWQSSVYYLEQWVFPFFLQEKSASNINDWHLYLQEYVDWLKRNDVAIKQGRKTALAASTVNNIVKSFNTFQACMLAYNKIDPASVRKAPTLPDHALNHRTFKDVILEEERDAVYARMKAIHPPAADFFWVLWHTGMRFNELFSLPITGLFRSTEIPNKSLHDELTKSNISYVGYIYLESQAANDDRKREGILLVRKPLKSTKEIGGKNTRIIPIRTKEVWNMLAVRYKAGLEEFAKKTYGPDKNNYVLFEDLEWNKAVLTLRKAYADLKMSVKQYHCCRHTFTTLLVGETRSFFLTRAITGHKKDKSFERYLHIFERIAIETKVEDQEIDVI